MFADIYAATVADVAQTDEGTVVLMYWHTCARKGFHIAKNVRVYYEDPDDPCKVTYAEMAGLGEDLRPCDNVECAGGSIGGFTSFDENDLALISRTIQNCGLAIRF